MSDAAKYIVATGAIVKSLCPKLFHVTCLGYLLHNCAMKVKSHFEDVDQLIAIGKSPTVKTKPDMANSLLLVARLSLLLVDGEAG